MTKLLLVEDDNNLREIYEARLQAEGYTIVSAHDGEEALVVAKAEKPDLIISDVMMPKISGFEMLDILRNTDGLRDVKVIMLTALGQSDDQQRADRLGADRYLVKSQVTLEDIVKVAHDLLNENGAESALAGASAAPETPTAPPELPAAPDLPVANPAPSTPTSESADTPSDLTPVMDSSTPAAPTTPALNDTSTDDTATTATQIPVSDATTSATEEAAVEAQIEDFVAGAGTSSSAQVLAAPDEKSAEHSNDAAEPILDSEAAAEAADAKLVTDAADSLTANTKSDMPAETESDLPQQKKVGGERVIEPIQSEPKKDIGDLLAIEEAKDANTAIPGAAANPVIVNDDSKGPQFPSEPPTASVSPQASKPTDMVDPNNIAL